VVSSRELQKCPQTLGSKANSMMRPFNQSFKGADLTSVIRASTYAKSYSDTYKESPILIQMSQEKIDECFKLINRSFADAILSRDAFFIDKVNGAIENKYLQFVFIGPGFDSKWINHINDGESKGQLFFELDLPIMIEQKKLAYHNANISVPKNLKLIHFDFEKDSILECLFHSGFDIKKPTAFLLEGVVYFINDQSLSEINNLNLKKTESDLLVVMDFWSDDMVNSKSNHTVKFYPLPYGRNDDEIIQSFKEMGFDYAQIEQLSKYLSSSMESNSSQISPGWKLLTAKYELPKNLAN